MHSRPSWGRGCWGWGWGWYVWGSGGGWLGGRGHRVWALPHHATFCPRMTQCYDTNPTKRRKTHTPDPSLTNVWIYIQIFFFHHRSVQSWFFMTMQPCAPCPDSCLSPSVLISLPTSIRSLTTDHVIIQLTQHQITSGSAWQLPIHISLFVSWGVG